MKRIHNFILLSVLAFVAVGCIEEEFNDNRPSAESGDEVQFGLSLGTPQTRTVYGDIDTTYKDNKIDKVFYPIYWVDGDKVQIFSPQCLSGRRNAEYKVELPANVDNPNYADDLTPTGEYGVQWGNADYAKFYSLYPSGNYTLSSKGDLAENITISPSQNIIVDGSSVKSDMEDCLMYAKNDGGKENEYKGVQKGQVVNLHYNPISTVFMVTLNVPSTSADDFTIQSISLTAPNNADDTVVNIAGTFSLKIDDGSFAEWGGSASNTVSARLVDKNTGGYYTLKKGNSVTVPLFIAPVTGLNTNGWKIKVVANTKEYVKTLGSQDLVAGKIHKVTLPNLSTAAATEWDVSKWMTYIPRNVYLSEVSIPGSWNTINSDYQSNTSISEQYKIGVRGFHLDTRWRSDDTSVSTIGNLSGSINALSVAGGAESGKYNGGDRVVSGSAKTFAEYLKQITDNVKSDEYMVLMCTFAQDSYDYTDSEGDNWVSEISKACDANTYVYDSKQLTQNTLVGDVLQKVIVIINMEGSFTAIPSNSKCLFVNMPLTLDSSLFGATLNDSNSGILYKGTASSTSPVDSGIDIYHTQAQISIAGETYTGSQSRDNVMGRGFAPTFGERRTVANNILSYSKSNYGNDNYAHDKWLYLGLGGYYSHYNNGVFGFGAGWEETKGSNATLASDFNSWINGKVTEMGTTPSGQTTAVPYYPVGIVLMNYVNNYASTVKNILTLNNKYRQQFDSTKPSDYNPNAKSLTEYGATATTGGDAF